ncbi:alpha/beta hydrolase [Sphaerisporangium rubeum]|uniref:Pimeloyl-ACP methyl ester carboxylesterase n=1 Tax=Sphaerisporangium rubeum TaxID=321317 RepID=A0A7X0IE38_9ACTN|nr:alpha/beta fold hydrolase [Sphaerisporangium rubeum]MBB6473350.1 pimeloyl-ACP methyl ester carboxylesterase [Sphaerisporangium rubeum]
MSRPPVLLVHGLASSFEHGWRRTGWADLLADEGRRVVPVDLPGHGQAGRSADPADYRDVEGHVSAAMAGDPVVDAAGFSAGAAILLRLLTREPGRFRRLVLMGVGDGVMEDQDVAALAAVIEQDTVDPADVTSRLFHRMARSEGNDPRALAAFLRRETGPLDERRLREVDVPVLFLIGDRDPAGLPARLAATLPRAETRVLPGADHFSTLTDPRGIQTALTFLEA